MISDRIKILMVEDNPADIELVQHELEIGGVNFVSKVAQNEREYVDAVIKFIPDIILSDYSLPGFDGPQAFKLRLGMAPDTPFIFVSGTIGEERSIEYIKNGVTDYVLKDKLFTLPSKVNRALKEAKEKQQKANADKALEKANRLYAFISQVNQTIVHIKEEELLFSRCCQIAVEFGKFKIAWIGLFDIEEKKITLAAHSGIPKGDETLFTDANFQDDGPQSHVLETGLYYCCNDISGNCELENWRPFTEKNGIHSFVVLPIKKAGIIIGSINLYSTEYNFFDKEELDLLVEVSTDISFAIDMFDNAKKQKEIEELVFQNEKRFRALIEKGMDLISLRNPEGNLFYVSPSICVLLGYSVEELLSGSVFDLIHPEDLINLKKKTEEILKVPGSSTFSQQRYHHKDGHWIWCEGTITNMLHEQGINALVSNFRNITERKRAEKKEEFNRNNLNALINNTKDLMWSIDKDLKLITFNQPFFDTTKLISGRELVKGDSIYSPVLSSHQLERFKISYARALAGEVFTEIEHIDGLGNSSWSEISYYPIRKGSEVIGTACHSRDITDRKKAEESIKFKAELLNTIGQAVVSTDMNGVINFWNKAAEEMYGWVADEAIGKNIVMLTTAEQTKDQAKQTMFELVKRHSWSGEFIAQRKDGNAFPVFVTNSPVYDEDDKLSGIIGVSSDITERKKDEAKIKESELRYRSLIEQATDAICIADASLKFIDINPYASEVFGYTFEEAMKLSLVDIIFTEDLVDNPLKIEQLRLGGTIRNERRLKRKDGTAVDMEVSTKIMEDGRLIMFGHDITERKKAEQLIWESEKRYRQIVETAQEGIWMIDENNRTTFVNKKMCELLEYTEEEMMGRTNLSFKNEEEQKNALQQIERRKRGIKESHESGFTTKSKRNILTQVSTNAITAEDGSYKGALAMITDITERKELENLLHKANTLARIGSWEVDLVKDTVYFSDITKEIHEVSPNFIPDLENAINFYKEGESRAVISEKIQEAIKTGKPWDVELEIITARHNEKWIRSIGEAEFENGKCISINGSFQDITGRKRSEILLKELNNDLKKNVSELANSEKRYSDLFQLSPQPMCLYEMETFRFIQVNKAAIEHYGYSEEEFLSMTLLDLVPEDEKQRSIETVAGQQREMNETYQGQSRNYKKNGEIIEVETFSTPIMINNKETTLVIAIDVTEKNLYEDKIMKAIIKTQEDERYEIGGELHDNVCQLLVVSQFSLAMLRKTLPPAAVAYHDQCKENIHLALEEIRNLSHRLAPASFGDSTMEEAFKRLVASFNLENQYGITLYFDESVKEYTLTLEIQLNIYRILQEQLKNIIKYAKATTISIEVIIYNKKLKMRIADNGVGFDTTTIKSGIGMANMRRRTELFAGQFNIESSPGNGCEIIVTIPLQPIMPAS